MHAGPNAPQTFSMALFTAVTKHAPNKREPPQKVSLSRIHIEGGGRASGLAGAPQPPGPRLRPPGPDPDPINIPVPIPRQPFHPEDSQESLEQMGAR